MRAAFLSGDAALRRQVEARLDAACIRLVVADADIAVVDWALPGAARTALDARRAGGAALALGAPGAAALPAYLAGADDLCPGPAALPARLRLLSRGLALRRELARRAQTARTLGIAPPAGPKTAPTIICCGNAAVEAAAGAARMTGAAWVRCDTPRDLAAANRAGGARAILTDATWEDACAGAEAPLLVIGGRGAATGRLDHVPPGAPPALAAMRLRAMIAARRAAATIEAIGEEGLRLAVRDPLTGLHNRRYAEAHLARLAARPGPGLALILADIDRFKALNDRAGHAAGDAALRAIGECLAAETRAADLVARFGGDEFLAALPGARAEEAECAAERLRRAVAAATGAQGLTLSAGVATMRPGEIGPDAALARADAALYAAKAAGGDRTVPAEAPVTPLAAPRASGAFSRTGGRASSSPARAALHR